MHTSRPDPGERMSASVPLSNWHTVASTDDRLTRHPDLEMTATATTTAATTARAPSVAVSAAALLEIDATARFQTIAGFGGAFTEAAAQNFFSLTAADQAVVLDRYFGAPFGHGVGGHGYQLGRIPINSCDFSPAQFSYDDVPDDGAGLPHFDHSVAHDAQQVIPFVLQAQARAARAARGNRDGENEGGEEGGAE